MQFFLCACYPKGYFHLFLIVWMISHTGYPGYRSRMILYFIKGEQNETEHYLDR